ncbi:hypothetical protein GCM10022222_79730 [Amycolatopsis ultiminotia]|uniref:Cation/H+ exchanger transmembrane domain-containing protein n=1 Tax=Amycolatopsis ultiminotia TaxID=543629 RepID=A0ABP6YI65_9PSEU
MTGELVLRTCGALVLALLLGAGGRWVARVARQPEVIGEITGGLIIGPVVLAVAGRSGLAAVFPHEALAVLKILGELGLVLFLVRVAQELRVAFASRAENSTGRTVGLIAGGAFVPAVAAGLAFAGYLVAQGDPALRGTAPTPAFVLVVVICLTTTAVPVLARILADRNLLGSAEGSLSMAAAVLNDAVNWPILAIGLGLASGRMSGALMALAVLGGGLVVAAGLSRVLSTGVVSGFCLRRPWIVAVLLAVLACAAAEVTDEFGLTTILGAFLVGLAVPPERTAGPWARVVGGMAKASSKLVPLFFVVAGVTVFTGPLGSLSWVTIVAALVLAVAGKLGGGYLGARLGGQPPAIARRIGVLLNTRGLTEIIVLQAGFAAGVLPPALYLTGLVMALATTALTGPLLGLLDRVDAVRRRKAPSAREDPA